MQSTGIAHFKFSHFFRSSRFRVLKIICVNLYNLLITEKEVSMRLVYAGGFDDFVLLPAIAVHRSWAFIAHLSRNFFLRGRLSK